MDQPFREANPVAVKHHSGRWEDEHGGLGPFKPGVGPRQDPVGEFPTGPALGTAFPDLTATAHTGELIELHAHRNGQPAVVVFYRSAVW